MDITGERELQMPDRSQGSDLTQFGDLVGTAKAMSPEQARGGRVTSASDLYSLGILMQELFTGEPAYEASHPVAVLSQVMRAETRPISGLDPDLTALIESLQSLDARRRPGAEATAERLRWILDRPQRQRRRRLVAGAAVGAFVVLASLLAVVSWLAVEASRARREADRRRKQAEALIGFMLVDLRPKLETVGRVDLLDDVGDRALAYFADIPESELTDDELARRVDAMRQIGEVRWLQGHLPEALAVFQRGRDLAAKLVGRDPGRKDWASRLAETQTWIGQVRFDQGRPAEARQQWKRALDIIQDQLRRHPDDEGLLDGLAGAHHNLGTALDASGDLGAALREYRESLAIQRRAAARSPRDTQRQAELGATLAFVSRALERQGDLAGALAERREYVEISERGAALEPGSAVRRQEAATSRGFLAGLLAALGERTEARRLYESGLADIADLAGKDPGNAGLQRWLAAYHSALGALIAEEVDSAGGLRHLRAARKILEPLVAQDPTNADWRSQLGVCQRRTAAALLPWSPGAAREEAHLAVETLRPLLDAPPDEVTRGEMAEAEIALASAEAALGNTREARAGWERALAVLAGLAAMEPSPRLPTHWKLLAPRARALLSLGRIEESRPAVERLRRMGCRDRTLEELWREVTIRP
jgi:tetratricopeptide (TPR) repeat protein